MPCSRLRVGVRVVRAGLVGLLIAFAGVIRIQAQDDATITRTPVDAGDSETQEDEEDRPRIYWSEGLWFEPRRLNMQIKVGGQAQNDSVGFAGGGDRGEELEDGVEWRRVRLYAQGPFLRRWFFKFQWDFVGKNPPNLKDAYLQFVFEPFGTSMAIRGGRFTTTFGLENDGNSNDTIFMEQGLTSTFVPPQETGVLVHSQSSRQRWDVSFSSGVSELTRCLICDVVGAAGRYSTGFQLATDRVLHVGGDYSRRWPDEAVRYAQRPESHVAPLFVDTGFLAARAVDTVLTEAAFLDGPFSIQGEYGLATVKLRNGSRPTFHAFYVFGSYSLTGEMRQYNESRGVIGRIQPRREFRDGSGGLGAFEVAYRFSLIDLNDDEVTGGTLHDSSFAVNWYPTRPTRISFNVVRAKRETWKAVWIFQGRFQLAF